MSSLSTSPSSNHSPSRSSSRKGGRQAIYTTTEARKQRNRDAQAAFRERRTEYIKEQEETIKDLKNKLQTLQSTRTDSTDECLMLRYKNSLLERILLSHGIDVQAELSGFAWKTPAGVSKRSETMKRRIEVTNRRKSKSEHRLQLKSIGSGDAVQPTSTVRASDLPQRAQPMSLQHRKRPSLQSHSFEHSPLFVESRIPDSRQTSYLHSPESLDTPSREVVNNGGASRKRSDRVPTNLQKTQTYPIIQHHVHETSVLSDDHIGGGHKDMNSPLETSPPPRHTHIESGTEHPTTDQVLPRETLVPLPMNYLIPNMFDWQGFESAEFVGNFYHNSNSEYLRT